MKGRVIKGVSGVFTVYNGTKFYKCAARGKLKQEGCICVGDEVDFTPGRENVIEKVFERKSFLIRPFLSNINQLIIVLTNIPEPDYMLADKLIVICLKQNIKPVICINKLDINSNGFSGEVRENYRNICGIIEVSAKEGTNIDSFKEILKGKFTALAGQSAVGKTSLLNAVNPRLCLETGELSEKLPRGRHTTRHSEIYFADGGGYIADTPGFSMLELYEIPYGELCLYYPDFADAAQKCRFRSCCHVNEPDCGVKEDVKSGRISNKRYQRYLKIYDEVKSHKIKY